MVEMGMMDRMDRMDTQDEMEELVTRENVGIVENKVSLEHQV